MEARFVILHPEDPREILMATSLIRCLKNQVEESLVYSVVKESHLWLLESNSFLDEVFIYRENPKELLDQLRDFLPDYLIDLHGGREVRRFKNKLKVLDFTINRRDMADRWAERAFQTCKLFDVQDDEAGQHYEKTMIYRDLLPSDFLGGYLVLALNSPLQGRPLPDEDIIKMVVMTEKPLVITGNTTDRNLADRIGQSTGCTVFPTCGDFSLQETGSVLANARGTIVFDPIWKQLSDAAGIDSLLISEKLDDRQLEATALWARSLLKSSHGRNAT